MEVNGRKNGRPVQKRSKRTSKRRERTDVSLLIEDLLKSKIQKYQDGDFIIEFSPLAFIPDIGNAPSKVEDDNDDNELLYYSAQGRE